MKQNKSKEEQQMIEDYKYECWLNSLDYFELTRGR